MRILLPGVGRSLFAGVPVGEKQVFRNLSIFPILFPGIIESYYLMLEQAIDSGVLVVSEVDESGNFFSIRFRTLRHESNLHEDG